MWISGGTIIENGATLPQTTTGTVSVDLFVLTATDGSNAAGLYRRTSNTGTSRWTMIGGGGEGIASGTSLPNATGTLGELFSLTAMDGSAVVGVYQRTSATDVTDAAWTAVGSAPTAGETLTSLNANDGSTDINDNLLSDAIARTANVEAAIPSGTTLPNSTGTIGTDQFVLTAVDTGSPVGRYIRIANNSNDADWSQVGTVDDLLIDSGTSLPTSTNLKNDFFILTQDAAPFEQGLVVRTAFTSSTNTWNQVMFERDIEQWAQTEDATLVPETKISADIARTSQLTGVGTTLPNATGTVGDLFSLTAADGSNAAGLYRRTSATDETDAAWTAVGAPITDAEILTGLNNNDGSTDINENLLPTTIARSSEVIPFGAQLPNVTGVVGAQYRLTAADGANPPGLYERIATTATDAAWRRNRPLADAEILTGLNTQAAMAVNIDDGLLTDNVLLAPSGATLPNDTTGGIDTRFFR